MENINPENIYVKPPLHLADIGGYSKNSKPRKKMKNPEYPSDDPILKTSGTFEFNFVNASKITKIISNLKNTKALGVDNIATEVWKKEK